MATTYDISQHPLLSKKAKGLLDSDPDTFEAVAEAAERALHLHGVSFSGSQKGDAELAIVYQLNYELEMTPEAQLLTSYKRGDRAYGYRSDVAATEARAWRIAKRLLDSLKKARTRQSSSISVGVEHVW